MPLQVTPIPCFTDNYAYLVTRSDAQQAEAVVVDASEAAPVLAALQGRRLTAILSTHHHYDHVGGNAELARLFPQAAIYSHQAEYAEASAGRVPNQTHGLADQAVFSVLGVEFQALHIPGHTTTAVAFYAATEGLLFTGDTLFGAGCGRLFEGTPAQMYQSLQRLLQLPPETRVYSGHEYTAKNLAFALAVEPHSEAVQARLAATQQLRSQDLPTVPSSLATEAATNPFLRCSVATVVAAAAARPPVDHPEPDPVEVFARLRAWRNTF
jgi:hydroxyacylglutathione hydrolase